MRPFSHYRLRFQLPLDRDSAFALLSEPRCLDLLTPAWFRLVPIGEIPEVLGAGTRLSYRLRWRGLPLRWTSRLTDWRGGEFFAYEQERGPYVHFRHEHLFHSVDDGTEIEDRVLFRAPGGRLIDHLVARPDLRRIFHYRRRRLLDLAAAFQRGDELPPVPAALLRGVSPMAVAAR